MAVVARLRFSAYGNVFFLLGVEFILLDLAATFFDTWRHEDFRL